MTEAQILQAINDANDRRLALYRELEQVSPFPPSLREGLVKQIQDLDVEVRQLYLALRTVRAEAVKAERPTAPDGSGVIDRLRFGTLHRPGGSGPKSSPSYPRGQVTPTRARHERRLKGGVA